MVIIIAAVFRDYTFVSVIIIKIMYYISIYVFETKRVLLKFRTKLRTIHCSKNRWYIFLHDNLEWNTNITVQKYRLTVQKYKSS